MFNGKERRRDLDKNRPWRKNPGVLDRHAWNSGGRSISSDIGFSLISDSSAGGEERRGGVN